MDYKTPERTKIASKCMIFKRFSFLFVKKNGHVYIIINATMNSATLKNDKL